MNTNKINQWIDALRSGRYKQIKGQLFGREDCDRCALGVYYSAVESENSSPSVYIFQRSIGLSPIEATILYEHIIEMNDTLGKDFNEIADYLEELS